jgi:hypothetical protein
MARTGGDPASRSRASGGGLILASLRRHSARPDHLNAVMGTCCSGARHDVSTPPGREPARSGFPSGCQAFSVRVPRPRSVSRAPEAAVKRRGGRGGRRGGRIAGAPGGSRRASPPAWLDGGYEQSWVRGQRWPTRLSRRLNAPAYPVRRAHVLRGSGRVPVRTNRCKYGTMPSTTSTDSRSRAGADRLPRAGAARRDPHHALGDALLHSVECRTCRVGRAAG